MPPNITLKIITVILSMVLMSPAADLYSRDISNLRGVNTNYFYSPFGLRDEVWGMTKELGVGLIRFPGGWPSNHYDWETGVIEGPKSRRTPRAVKLDDFMSRAKKEGISVVYVINIFDHPEKIVHLVKTISENEYPVIAFEMGNELYSKEYGERIGGPDAYRKKSMEVARALRNVGNKLPLGIVIAPPCVPPGRARKRVFERWNRTLSNHDLSMFQAVIFHHYRGFKYFNDAVKGISDCADKIEKLFPGKEIWLTEWNLGGAKRHRHTMLHAIYVSKLYAAILKEKRITMANYHALDTIVWGLFIPDAAHFKLPEDLSKGDRALSTGQVNLIRRLPYFALKALFQIAGDFGGDITGINHSKITGHGGLPVDIFTFKKEGLEYVMVINPNDITVPLEKLQKYLGKTGLEAIVLSADSDAANAASESVLPEKITAEKIEAVSVSVFKISSAGN